MDYNKKEKKHDNKGICWRGSRHQKTSLSPRQPYSGHPLTTRQNNMLESNTVLQDHQDYRDLDDVDSLLLDFVQKTTKSLERGREGSYGSEPCTPIETRHVPGFIPWTNGGYTGQVYCVLAYAWGAGSAGPIISNWIDVCLRDCHSQWLQDKGYNIDDALYSQDHKDTNEAQEFEHEWLMEGAEYNYRIQAIHYHKDNRRNVSGKNEVWLRAELDTGCALGEKAWSFDVVLPLEYINVRRLDMISTYILNNIE